MQDAYFDIIRADDASTLRLVGELDLATAPVLREALRAVNGKPVTLDLADLTFIDSTGLHVIVQFAGSTDGSGRVRLVNVSPEIARIFDITSLSDHARLEITAA